MKLVHKATRLQSISYLGRGSGGGLMVCLLSDDLSSNPTEVCSFNCKIVVFKNENNKKGTELALFNRKSTQNDLQWFAKGYA